MENYYQLPQISNSDLTIVEHILKGKPYKKPEAAFRFGHLFHELLLEPEKFRAESNGALDIKLLYNMQKVVLSNIYCKSLLNNADKENVVLWHEYTTGIECKCKLDIRQNGLVADIKTTSARTMKSFINCCQLYNYDRQMAFYADSVGAKEICIIGVSKKVKKSFFVHKSTQGRFIHEGQKKYQYLLQKLKVLNLFEQVWYERSLKAKRLIQLNT